MGRAMIKASMVRRRYAQMELSQAVLFGLVLPEPEKLMEPWLREIDKAPIANHLITIGRFRAEHPSP